MKYFKFFIYFTFLLKFTFSFARDERILLIDFDSKNLGHPFDIVEDVNHNKIGTFKPHKYYNFDLDKLNSKRWNNYDQIELDIYNPNRTAVLFYFTLQDDKTESYWTQLNHVQTLSPGWNRLMLNLHQLVGERGSVKVNRQIDLSKLRKMFIVVDPDEKSELSDISFKVDNIFLKKEEKLVLPKDVLAFDFSDVIREADPFLNITDKTVFSSAKGSGFTDINLFRNEDSKFASSILRSTINVNKATFKVTVPNGKYGYQLIIDQLGYWDIPFYKERMVYVNNKPIYKEIRNNANDFLKDILRFEKVEPNLESDPYDIYFKNIFNKIESEVEVKNGEINFTFEGDETGIALNSLVIWDAKKQKEALQFLNSFEEKSKNEFNQSSRSINVPKIPINTQLVTVIKSNGSLNIAKNQEKLSDVINLYSSINESDYSYLQIYNQNKYKKLKIKIDKLVDGDGKVLTGVDLKIFKLFPQFVSPDLNHETYQISARIAKDYDFNDVLLRNNELSYYVVELKNNLNIAGKFKGVVSFDFDGHKVEVPIKINLSVNKLVNVNFPVGFMALDPLPYSYFKDHRYEDLRTKYRFKALKIIADSGFTTFSGLPEVKVSVLNNKLSFDFKKLEETLSEVKKYDQITTVFSYGGQFPNKLLNMDYLPYDMKEDVYHAEVNDAIKNYFSDKSEVKIVHTFSDEAAGYNDRVGQDIYKGQLYKRNYPQIPLGGFTQFGNKDLLRLNNLFDYGFYPYLSMDQVKSIKYNGHSFGLYNTSQGGLDDPRFTFGIGLYAARKIGMGYYLEWNSVGFNDYPYLDFDGRESDIVIFYPSINGEIYRSLRFLLSVEGLNLYRKIATLESLLIENKIHNNQKAKVEMFLDKIKKTNYFFSDPKFMALKNRSFYEIKDEINQLYHDINVNK